MKVAIVGHTTHDIYHRGYQAGGTAFYGAHAYRALGHEVELHTSVGADFLCNDSFDDLPREVRRGGTTTTFFNVERRGEPRLQLVEAIGEPIPARSLGCDFVHLAPVMGELDLSSWLAANATASVAISLQGWVREAVPWSGEPRPDWPRAVTAKARLVQPAAFTPDQQSLSQVAIVCASEEDIAGQPGLFQLLRRTVPQGCLTLGARGSMVWNREDEWRIEAVSTEVVDTTGAGDTYGAAFCAAVWSGARVAEAGATAARAAAAAIGCSGPLVGL